MKASDPYHPTLVKPETGDMFGGDGLTTRQRYIMAAMQGLCAGGAFNPWEERRSLGDCAVAIADATLRAAGATSSQPIHRTQ